MKNIYIIAIFIVIVLVSIVSIIMMGNKKKETFNNIPIAQSNTSSNSSNTYIVDNIFKRPSTCIFGDSTICDTKSCSGIDWKNPIGATDECKKVVNSYCRIATKDSGCGELRNWKKTQLENYRKENKKIEHPSINIDKDCSSCLSKVDLSKFTMVK